MLEAQELLDFFLKEQEKNPLKNEYFDAVRIPEEYKPTPEMCKKLEEEGFIVLPQPDNITIIAIREQWTHIGELL